MRISLFVFVLPVLMATSAVAAPMSALTTCPEISRPAPTDSPERKAAALSLVGSATQLLLPLGRPVLASNFATTILINNGSEGAQRERSIIDSLITNENANTVADGLGTHLAAIYKAKAFYRSDDDGAHPHCGEIGPAVSALIGAVNATAAADSGAGKNGFADAKKKMFPLPPGGVYDVLGIAYGHKAGTVGADSLGNSRPFQTAPVWASTNPSIRIFDGTDFFGKPTNSRMFLMGPTAADVAEGRTGSDLTNSPSYPSGHTTFGYTESLILAMLVPERYRALAYRGSEYGDSRIVLGAHYAIDVIAGRTLATYDLAQDLAERPGYAQVAGHTFRNALAAAATELRGYLQHNGCPSIQTCAAHDPIVRADNARVASAGTLWRTSPAEAYAFRLNYGLATMAAPQTAPEPVPAEAAALLVTRFPYLSAAQRLDILRQTEGPSGFFLDISPRTGQPLTASASKPESEAGAYSRLNLFAAAGGFSSFDGPVTVNQDPASITDPDLQPFRDLAVSDEWSNDISGAGGLTKHGSGTLTLSGSDTFAGPIVVDGGTLDVAGSVKAPATIEAGGVLTGAGHVGDVTIAAGGTLRSEGPQGGAPLSVDGTLSFQAGGIFAVSDAAETWTPMTVNGPANLDGAQLVVHMAPGAKSGVPLPILVAKGGLRGSFAKFSVDGASGTPRVTLKDNKMFVTVDAKS